MSSDRDEHADELVGLEEVLKHFTQVRQDTTNLILVLEEQRRRKQRRAAAAYKNLTSSDG
jgi:hypothetical protein